MKTVLTGWGRTPTVAAEGFAPRSAESAGELLSRAPALPRGLGRSYGDASLPA